MKTFIKYTDGKCFLNYLGSRQPKKLCVSIFRLDERLEMFLED